MAGPFAAAEAPAMNQAEEDDWWEEFWSILTDDDETIHIVNGMYEYALHIDKCCSRRPYRTPKMSGFE
jgi:hypothetical protein